MINQAYKTMLYLVSILMIAQIIFLPKEVVSAEISLPKGQMIYLRTDIFAGLLNDMPEYSSIAAGLGYAGHAGWRSNRWGVFVGFERDFWVTHNWQIKVTPGVLNILAGGEYLSFNKKIRTSIAAGTSTLMFDSVFDERGSTGLYIDIRPSSLRWTLNDKLTIEFCPISVSFMNPVMGKRPIKKLEYRSYLTIEASL